MPTMKKVLATGDFFSYEDGREFRYVGLSDFGLFKRMCMQDGPEALVRPILIERRQIADRAGYTDPIVSRVFRCSDPGNTFGQTPAEVNFDLIQPFLNLCAEYNFYVDWTQGDDDHDMMFGRDLIGLQDFHNKFTSYIKSFCFYETENEPFKNGNAPKRGIVPPASSLYLRDSGDYGDIGNPSNPWPFSTILEFCSYHGQRNSNPGPRWPKWLYEGAESLSVMRSTLYKPSVLKEQNKYGPYWQDPNYGRILGHQIAYGGVLFHSQKGLESNGYDEATKQAASFYFTGVKGAML